MTILFSDGFESGDFSAWTWTDGNPAISEFAKGGSYSLVCANTTNAKLAKFVAVDEIYINMDVYFPETESTGTNIITVTPSDWGHSTTLILTIAEKITLLYEGNWLFEITDISFTEWFNLEFHWKKGAGNGVLEVWIDGTLKYGNNTLTLTDDLTWVLVGINYANSNSSVYIDNVKLSDSYIGTEVSNRLLTGVGLGCVSSP